MADTPLLYGQSALNLAVSRLRPYLNAALVADMAGTETPATDAGKDLVAEAGRAALALRGKMRCIKPYAGLSGEDQQWFDIAVGVLAAITLRSAAIGQAHDGLIKRKAGDEEEVFAVPDADEERRWAAELAEAVGNIGCVQKARIQIASTLNVISAAGRSRTREENGRLSLPTLLASLLPSGWGGDRRSPSIWFS